MTSVSNRQLKMEEAAQELLADMRTIMAKKRPSKDTETSLDECMEAAVVRAIHSARHNDNEAAQRLMDFSTKKAEEKLLKISSPEIPEGILPEGTKGTIHDVRVGGYHCDDKIYSSDPAIREKVSQKLIVKFYMLRCEKKQEIEIRSLKCGDPRGTSVMELRLEGGEREVVQDTVIYGNRKFTGDIGDEDDDTQPESNGQWKKYFLKDMDEAHQVVCMKKINGDAAHFSGRCVWDTLPALGDKHYRFLQKFLHLTNCTAICEILQPENQHIMNLSALEKPRLHVLGFTPPAGDEDPTSLVAFPPHHTLHLLSCLGLTVPAHTVIQAEDVQRHREEIRQGKHGYREEGEVLYFLDESEKTIGLVKTKTVWYIMLRALREKVAYAFHKSRQQQQHNAEKCISGAHRRFEEINKWLLFSESCLEEWKKLASSFITWIAEEIKKGNVVAENIRPKYPEIWDRFLEVKKHSDYVEL
ncbi:hypothetical protein GWK47_017247 [Chionoecetes opilio]|uniref:Uncharacterized protein n=1 Tax=Chionoecetes opilio TaxID=41210 RepID=A0A8J5CM58_CHIOP|nr:hypothetical protein GWK47_017247 [Chionoecetes opilio]